MKKSLRKLLPFVLLLLSFVIVLPFLTSCSGTIPGVNGSEIVNLLFPQPIVFAAQIIATIVLVIVVSRFVWKPYNEMIEKRKKYVMSEINDVEQKKQILFEEEKSIKENYLQTQIKTSQMIQEAKDQSDLIISEAKVEAKNNYDLAMKNASEELDKMRIKMKDELQSQNIDLVLLTAEQLAMKNVDSADNRKFVEDFLKQIDKEL